MIVAQLKKRPPPSPLPSLPLPKWAVAISRQEEEEAGGKGGEGGCPVPEIRALVRAVGVLAAPPTPNQQTQSFALKKKGGWGRI